jgi:hypothetical protein
LVDRALQEFPSKFLALLACFPLFFLLLLSLLLVDNNEKNKPQATLKCTVEEKILISHLMDRTPTITGSTAHTQSLFKNQEDFTYPDFFEVDVNDFVRFVNNKGERPHEWRVIMDENGEIVRERVSELQ